MQAERFLTFPASFATVRSTCTFCRNCELVASLSRKHSIGALRVPQRLRSTPGHNARAIVTRLMSWLGRRSVRALQGSAIQRTDAFAGFDMSGVVIMDWVLGLLEALPEGVRTVVSGLVSCPWGLLGLP